MWMTCGKVVDNTKKLSTIRGYPHSFIRKSAKCQKSPVILLINSFQRCKDDLVYTGFVDSLGMITIM